MFPPFLLGLDPIRLMMALTNLVIVAIVGLTLEWILVHTWPEQFRRLHGGSAWRPLYATAGVTFLLTYLGTLWLLQAPRQMHHPLWQLAGVMGAACATWMLWRMRALWRPAPEAVKPISR